MRASFLGLPAGQQPLIEVPDNGVDPMAHTLAEQGDRTAERRVHGDVETQHSLGETVELYQTVHGEGQLAAATLVVYLSELDRWDGRALTSLVELPSWSRDSENKSGNRSIRGGHSPVRRALKICAWAVLMVDCDL